MKPLLRDRAGVAAETNTLEPKPEYKRIIKDPCMPTKEELKRELNLQEFRAQDQ